MRVRADWFTHRIPAIRAMRERIVFIDETSVKTNLTRLRGRSLRGARLTASAPFGRWGTQTLTAGLTRADIIAPWVIKGAMDGLCLRRLHQRGAGAGDRSWHGSRARQPRKPSQQGSTSCPARTWLLVPLPAALQPRPQSNREGLLQAQSPPAQGRRPQLHGPLRCTWRSLRSVHT